jgi:1,2-phenylacetyl-CoA epoxidase PaaB subunit
VSGGLDNGWLVLARTAYDEPLRHIGVVNEEDESLALVAARSIYDEQSWIEMVIVPRSEVREAIRS